jgi:biotin--protein ligase
LIAGFSALESKYYQRWLHSGQTVELEEREEESSKVSKVCVRIQGLTATGYLRAVDDSDESYELHPDGNSFDFLHGLIRNKV